MQLDRVRHCPCLLSLRTALSFASFIFLIINLRCLFLVISNNLFFQNYFIFGCVGSSLLHTGFLQLRRAGATLHCGGWASHGGGFSCRGAQALGTQAQQLWLVGSRAQAPQLWRMGLVALWHVGSSQTRARTCVPCLGRRILNHCTTREALLCQLYFCRTL